MKADKACIDVAAGRAPADLVFKNVNVVNVFSEEIITADVAVAGGVIAGVGSYRGRTELDCTDKFLCPGFIDAHIHIESSLAAPFEFARAATRSGTTTIVADPHEIVNVCGAQAVQYLLDATENLPLNVYLMLPSSVPATPFETNGADFTAADMAPFMAHPRVLGLGEVMCYPDVLAARQTVLEKLALAADAGKRADGHAPGLSGRELQAYAAAGIRTEHECTTFAEAAEKLRAGLAVLVREGSAAKNLSVLVNGLLDSDLPADRFLFCTDDKHLDGIAPAPRGVPQIEVTFDIDANGIVNVSAKDLGTGKEQHITITSSTNMSKEDVEKAVKEAEQYAAEDKKKREEVDIRNGADQMVFQTEKAMGEFGDKVSESEKTEVNAKLEALKEALKGSDIEAIKAKQEDLQKAFYAISEKVYKDAAAAGQAAGAQAAGPDMGGQPAGGGNGGDDNVVDAEYKEV